MATKKSDLYACDWVSGDQLRVDLWRKALCWIREKGFVSHGAAQS